ncbi:MAG: WD40/YVTN/BNR-like repeat-containing protein [Thermoanaerobaculia bacterium]
MKRSLLLLSIAMFCSTASFPAPAAGAAPNPGTRGEVEQPPEPPDFLQNFKIRNLGPTVGGGRVSSVAGVPGDPNVFYVGAAGGGVFKTVDGGNSWKAIFEKEDTASIGAVAVAPSNPNVVWVGTGEANIRNDTLPGRGVYLSNDAGQSWKRMGLERAGQISSIVIDPDDPRTVFVGVFGHEWAPNADRGVFRTTDGGLTWSKVLFVNDGTGAIDLAMEPGNPRVLFAAMWHAIRHPWELVSGGEGSGLYRSTDGGTTWKHLTKGLPDGPLGRIAVAQAPTNPRHVYALIEAKKGMLWESLDRGDEWKEVSDSKFLNARPFYFSRLFVSPEDEKKLYFLSFELVESDDGGKTARAIDRGVHVDHHALWIDPKDSSRMIQGNDGGVYVSADKGKSWRYLNNIPIEQFYMVAADRSVPYNLCGGLQDNNAWCGPSNSLSRGGIAGADWFVTAGGDGEYAVPAPSDPSIVYSDSQNGFLNRLDLKTHINRSIRPSLEGVENKKPSELKYRFNWTSPIAVSASDANEVYLGANVLFRSRDGGGHWDTISPDLTRNDKSKQQISGGPIEHDLSGAESYATILSITIAESDPRVIWVGTDDGLVQVTRDGGSSWTNVTKNIPKAPEWARVYQIGVSPFDAGTAYVAFDAHMLDDDRPYVYKTSDSGKTWTSISAGLPDDASVNVVREDRNLRGFLVAGTDRGAWFSRDSGSHWRRIRADLPTVAVFDLKFVSHDLVLASHGRGLFVLDNITPLEELSPSVETAEFHLFSARPGTLFHHWGRGGFGKDPTAAPNPPDGVEVDYLLKSEIKNDEPKDETPRKKKTAVQIVVTDEQGRPVATRYGESKQGLDRFIWNQRYDGPKELTFEKQPPASEFFERGIGPHVLPGSYKITVTVQGKSQSTVAEVLADPRIKIDPAAFREEVRAGLESRNELSALNEALNRTDSLQKQLKSIEGMLKGDENEKSSKYGAVLDAAAGLGKTLKSFKDSVYNSERQSDVGLDFVHYLSRFHDEMTGLTRGLASAYDDPPDAVVKSEIADLRKQLDDALGRFERIRETDVPAFNKVAQSNGAPTVFAGDKITVEEPKL